LRNIAIATTLANGLEFSEEDMESRIRPYGRGELIADRCVHYAGLVAGLIGSLVLIVEAAERERALTIVSVVIYGIGLIGMIGASALYNSTAPSRRKELFRRLDHAAIFLMIAGTYTPFALVRMGGAWGFGIAAFVWLAAVAGMTLKLVSPQRLEGISTVLYLALGWVILIAPGPLFDAVPLPAIMLLAVGALLYMSGIVFHMWHRLPYHNAVWHGFVLSAAACHWVAILDGVVRAA
jgi:hemolysin III